MEYNIISIPIEGCRSCRFYSETEGGEAYCSIHNEYWEVDVYDPDMDEAAEGYIEIERPSFCKTKEVLYK